MALIAMVIALSKVPPDVTKGERLRNDYLGMTVLTVGLVSLMLVVYQGAVWGWNDFKTIGFAAVSLVLLAAFPFVERRIKEPLVPPGLMRDREFQALCLCSMVICQIFFVVLLYFTQYAMKFLGSDPIWAVHALFNSCLFTAWSPILEAPFTAILAPGPCYGLASHLLRSRRCC